MPEGGFIHHNPVRADQRHYELRYANTLSLLTKKYGETLDADSWEIDQTEYRKRNVMVGSFEDKHTATAGPHVYCHKRQTVLQLVNSIRLVMGYTADDRIIISGMSYDYLPKCAQQVSNTMLWTSSIVRVTICGGPEIGLSGDFNSSVTGDNRLRYLRFQNKTDEIEVSLCAEFTYFIHINLCTNQSISPLRVCMILLSL